MWQRRMAGTCNGSWIYCKGADLDDGMLSYCKDFGLDVVNSDAISFLKSYPENSVDVISSFHVVEHIGFANVQLLIEESFRVLKPGGC
ncbi:methyltransferase domain-containing protein [Escherichia coli]|uniref:methyltransferase domain-containing protein n=1 Tax=Escherichia coli TaxID=562 RepID=UPI003D80FD91